MAECSVPRCRRKGPTVVLFNRQDEPFHFCLECAPWYWARGYRTAEGL